MALSGTIIAGLGNPGREYSQTRHNIGFLVMDELAGQVSCALNKNRFDADFVKTRISGRDVFLIKPMTYMNRSGIPVQRFAGFYKIPLSHIVIVHDDMDLETGLIRIAVNRGHGGHNGVRSIIDSFGSKDFIRIRVGVGRPKHPADKGNAVTGHVLGRFASDEKDELDGIIANAATASKLILKHGAVRAMNQFNRKK